MGLRAIAAPALSVHPLPARLPPPEGLAALLLTSAQAVAPIPRAYRGLPVFAVGDATAARAREAGFASVTSASGDAADLAALVRAACPPPATLLLATGRGLGQPLAAALRDAGYRVARRSVYARAAPRRLPAAALAALRAGDVAAALFFSADTAASFASLLRLAGAEALVQNTDAVAISEAAAVPLRPLPWRRIRVAERPNQDAMLALLR
ncbi:MAG: uroporphyrinogen-III synthase [Proteobacteria bacterium]|nr:uroporphyrinogen-III synthase [Pseudomonadota bacterium]